MTPINSGHLTWWLRQQLDADAETARAAHHDGSGRWTADESDAWAGRVEDADGFVVVYDEGSPSAQQAAHIARHDPASVLADVAAKRRIVDFCEWLFQTPSDPSARVVALKVLREMATGLAGRDGFEEGWRT